jgi:hypothetical protein
MENEQTPPEQGTPSRGLKEIIDDARTSEAGGILDASEGYEPITESNPEEGIYELVGGYLDREGVLHREVHLRAMSGHEEDLLGNRSVDMIARLNGIMAQCVKRIGTITDRGEIIRAVNAMPSGSRIHLLILLRVTSHYKTEKDIYEVEMRCPMCSHLDNYKVNLLELDRFESEDPCKPQHTVKLPYSEEEVLWKLMGGEEDHVMSMLTDVSEHERLTFAIILRLVAWDGEPCELRPSNMLDGSGKKVRLDKKAKALMLRTKNLSVGDREALRESFMDNEPGVDTDLEVECEKCHEDFFGRINVTQPSFFFPRATSRRSKRRRSI